MILIMTNITRCHDRLTDTLCSPRHFLRPQDPVAAEAWEGVRDGSTAPPLCPQLTAVDGETAVAGEEDCLYLSVYTSRVCLCCLVFVVVTVIVIIVISVVMIVVIDVTVTMIIITVLSLLLLLVWS